MSCIPEISAVEMDAGPGLETHPGSVPGNQELDEGVTPLMIACQSEQTGDAWRLLVFHRVS